MSAADVEKVREIYAHWSRGDWAYGAEYFAADLAATTFDADGDEIRVQGRDGLAGWLRNFLEEWQDFRQEATELVDHGDRVFAVARQFAVGRVSRVPLEMSVYTVWVFRDGQVVEFHTSRYEDVARRNGGLDAR